MRVGGGTYRHHLAALANHALRGTDVHHRAVQAATGLLDAPHDDENPCFSRNPFQLLPRPIPSRVILAIPSLPPNLPPHPRIARAAAALPHDVPQIDGALEVGHVFVPPRGGAVADGAAESGPARVAAQVGLGKQEEVGRVGLRSGGAGEAGDVGEGLGRGGLCGGGGCREADSTHGCG